MIDSLLLPFQLPFMQSAFIVASLIAIPMAMMSCFVVLKGWSLLGDAVSHAVLPGIIGAYVLGIPMIVGAFVTGLACAILSGVIPDHSRIKYDTAIGVVFSGFFALGLVLYVQVPTTLHLDHILYGDLLGVAQSDILLAIGVCSSVFIILLIKNKDLSMYCFDPIQTQALGISLKPLHYGLLIALSLLTVVTLSVAGLILSIGLLITPGAIAFLLARRFGQMQVIAICSTLVSNIGGLYASFFLNTAPAPTITMALAICFSAALLVRRLRQSVRFGIIKIPSQN